MKCNVTKEALLEARKKEASSYRIVHKEPLVHGGMKYKCQSCGKEWFMCLEVGVEDFGNNGRPHQPCPFCIACECGGVAHDISGLLPLPDVRPLFPGMKYFAYDKSGKKDACGIKSIYEPEEENNLRQQLEEFESRLKSDTDEETPYLNDKSIQCFIAAERRLKNGNL